MNILGINFGHDGALAIIKDGKLFKAISRERITRIKKARGICKESLEYILRAASLRLEDIQAIAFSSYFINYPNDLSNSVIKLYELNGQPVNRDLIHILGGQTAAEFIAEISGIKIRAFLIQHHIAHIASAYYTSPFNRAAGLSVDASGVHPEYCSLTAIGEGNRLDYFYCPGIMAGNVYSVFTERLGIGPGLTKAGTLMALAAFGQKYGYAEDWEEDFASWYTREFQPSDRVHTNYLWNKWVGRGLSFVYPHTEIPIEEVVNHSASLQYAFERCLVKETTKLFNDTKNINDGNLILSGGSFLNSDANMKIYEESGFKNIHLFPACGDDGTAAGAALYLLHHICGFQRVDYSPKDFMYLGHDYNNETEDTIDYDQLAKDLDNGAIIGWFQGQSEFGPRALGNRSFLASPKTVEMKDRINLNIKHRERYRPFAPAVLSSEKSEWFDLDFESKLMLFITQVKKPELVPAICHVDNSARVQTVEKSDNKKFFNLLTAFHKLTGIPMLLNTSLNDNGEPLVESPDDAKRLFERTEMEMLVIGNEVIRK